MPSKRRLAYFVSPHGFGHAARAAAVMESLHAMDAGIQFDIFTSVPSWFFETSLTRGFDYQFLVTDVGFVQKTALEADLGETLAALYRFFPVRTPEISALASLLLERDCELVVCDIAPMGLLASRHAGLRSVLVENFTWDWLYEEYLAEEAGFEEAILLLRELFALADFHVQTEPVCRPTEAHLTTGPVSRKPRLAPDEVKARLGIAKDTKVVMITMGGIPEPYPFLQRLKDFPGIRFVLPGVGEKIQVRENLVCLPHRSEWFHPDLVNAADGLIGKVGYSTLAEVYFAGIPFGYIGRNRFRESGCLISFVEEHMEGLAVEEKDFYSGAFLDSLPRLLSRPRIARPGPNGADRVARFILEVLCSRDR